MRRTIACCMIVKNEEQMLSRALDSVKGCDAIYILDTGSQDRTVEVAKRYTDNVFIDFVWSDDFSAAQNWLLDKVRGKEDFILSLDADEYVVDFNEVRRAVELATTDMIRVNMIAEGSHRLEFGFGRLFRNSPDIFWVQPIHKHLNIAGEGEHVGNVSIVFGYSPAHNNDPDRALRILEKVVAAEGDAAGRNLYYLGREYWYKGRCEEAIDTLWRYVRISVWDAEKAESFLIMSQSYSRIGQDDEARNACLQCLKINPNFKEAVQWMADIAQSPENSLQWKRMARTANNRDVLWDRLPANPVHDIIFIEPHQDDSVLFGAYTLMRYKPLIISVTSAYIQSDRGDTGCDANTRRKETIEAAKIVGCPVVFLDIPDKELTEEILRERLKHFNPETIYVPAIHEGGNPHHNIVGKVGYELFGKRCERYCSYANGSFEIVKGSWEIRPTQTEMELKNKMLDCYQSQINLPSTAPHFSAVRNLSEWLL